VGVADTRWRTRGSPVHEGGTRAGESTVDGGPRGGVATGPDGEARRHARTKERRQTGSVAPAGDAQATSEGNGQFA